MWHLPVLLTSWAGSSCSHQKLGNLLRKGKPGIAHGRLMPGARGEHVKTYFCTLTLQVIEIDELVVWDATALCFYTSCLHINSVQFSRNSWKLDSDEYVQWIYLISDGMYNQEESADKNVLIVYCDKWGRAVMQTCFYPRTITMKQEKIQILRYKRW